MSTSHPLEGLFHEIDNLLRPLLTAFGRTDYEAFAMKEAETITEATRVYTEQLAQTYITLSRTAFVSELPLRNLERYNQFR